MPVDLCLDINKDHFTEARTSPERVHPCDVINELPVDSLGKSNNLKSKNTDFETHDGLIREGNTRHTTSPDGYFYVEEDVIFDPAVHLALNQPETVVSLHDLGYSAADTKDLPTSFGCATPFRLLSDEGIKQVRLAVERLREWEQSSRRIPAVLRGACFRSRFLRDLSECELVQEHISKIAGCSLVPHPMWIQQAHTNLAPKELTKNIDSWHTDGTPFVVVLFVTDEELYDGGNFEYFAGTATEGRSILKTGAQLPEERVRHLPHQRAGYCAFMQGSALFHRVSALKRGAERTTVVFSFHALDCNTWEPVTNVAQTYNDIDPIHVLLPDWVAYRAWRGSRRLTDVLEQIDEQELDVGSKAVVNAAKTASKRLSIVADRVAWTDDRDVLSQLIEDAVSPLVPHDVSNAGSDCAALEGLHRAIARTVEEADGAAKDVKSLQCSEMEYY